MKFGSLSSGALHTASPRQAAFDGPPRLYDPLGGSERSEAQLFRLLDLVSYLHARRGIVTREEIVQALPGWSELTDAVERLYFRSMTTLQAAFGMTILSVSERGEPAAYVLRDRFSSPMLAFASGRGAAPVTITELPEFGWTTVDCANATAGVLRTLAMTSREALHTSADLEAQWPLTPALLQQFLRRWEAREDLSLHHHRALRLLWCGSTFRLSTRWPLAPHITASRTYRAFDKKAA
ncbi:MAG: hypothetical protein P3A58_06300 [Gemmatimonadota bacterium]|nr:hypothetical protein [Gemmatimonadota bacterium]